jgi:hypothetical protein
LLDAYRLTARDGFIDLVLQRIRDSRDGIVSGAAGGEEVCLNLQRAGVVRDMSATLAYVAGKADLLRRAIE